MNKTLFFLEIYARTCYCIMLGIKQSRDHVTNQSMYQFIGQVPLRKTIRERQTTYLNQISSHILQSGEQSLEAWEIRKIAMNKSKWSQLFVVSKKKNPPVRSSKLVRWWWWWWWRWKRCFWLRFSFEMTNNKSKQKSKNHLNQSQNW